MKNRTETQDQAASPRRKRRWLKGVAGVAAALVLLPLVAIPVVAWAVDLGGVVRQQLVALLPQVEQRIGRKVSVGQVELHLLPTLRVEVHDVAVAADAEQAKLGGAAAQPLVQVGSARVGVAVWRLLLSLGHDVRVDEVELVAPTVNVVRFADGTLSYQDVLDRLASEPSDPAQPSGALTAEQLAYLRGIQLARVAITSAAIHLTDATPGGAMLRVDQLDLVVKDARLGAPLSATLDAAVLAGARNLHLELALGPLPDDLDFSQPLALLRRVVLRLQPVEVAPLLVFLPSSATALSSSLALAQARLEADLTLEMPTQQGKLRLVGSLGARGLVLAALGKPGSRGQAADLSLKTDVEYDPLAGRLDAKELSVAAAQGSGEMKVSGSAALSGLWQAPRVEKLALASQGLSFERLAALLPPGTLPAGATLSGPIALSASGSGSPEQAQVTALVDLGAATILVPELRKPAGTPLRVEASAQVTPKLVQIKRLALVLGPLSLVAHGSLYPPADVDLVLDSVDTALDPLLRLLPTVAGAVPAQTVLGGRLAVSGNVRRRGTELGGKLRIALSDAAARTPGLELQGRAGLDVTLAQEQGTTHLDALADLSAARIRVPGSIDKAAGVPMRITLGADQVGQRITLRAAKVEAPGLTLAASGSAELGTQGKVGHLDVKAPGCSFDLPQLAKVVPLLNAQTLPPWLLAARLRFDAALSGDPQRLAAMTAQIGQLQMSAAGGQVRGQLAVTGLDQPQKVTFDLAGSGLDLDRILGTSSSGAPTVQAAAKGSSKSQPVVVPPVLRTLSVDGSLKLDAGHIGGAAFRDLVARLNLVHGKGQFQTLRASIFGGTLVGDGSTVDFTANPTRFSLHAKLQRVQVEQVVALKSPTLAQRLSGQGNLDLTVTGDGLTWEQIAPKLSGQLDLGLATGALKATPVGALALSQLFSRVPALASQAPHVTGDQLPLRDLQTTFHVADGKLRASRPLVLKTSEGTLSLNGAIGLDQSLALDGQLSVPADVVNKLSGGRVKLAQALPVSLRLGGALTSPKVELVDAARTVAVLAAGVLAGFGGQAVGQALGQAVGGALGKDAGAKVGGMVGQAGQALGQVAKPGGVQQAAAQAQKQVVKQVQKQATQSAPKNLQDAAKNLGKGLGGLFK